MSILSEACCNPCLHSTATISSEIRGVIFDAQWEKCAKVMLKMSQSESVKKRWVTVESTVFYNEALEANQYWIYQKALTLSSLIIMDFFRPRLSVVCLSLSCVWFCPSRLRKASGHGRARARVRTRPVNPLKLGRPCWRESTFELVIMIEMDTLFFRFSFSIL